MNTRFIYVRDVIEYVRGIFGAHSGHNRAEFGALSWHVRGLSWHVRGSFVAQPGPDWPRISAGVAPNTHELDTIQADGHKNMRRMRAG